MFGAKDKIEEVEVTEHGYDVKTRTIRDEAMESSVVSDEPPEHFVERIDEEGGTVYAIPFMDALRGAIRKRRGVDVEASTDSDVPATAGSDE